MSQTAIEITDELVEEVATDLFEAENATQAWSKTPDIGKNIYRQRAYEFLAGPECTL